MQLLDQKLTKKEHRGGDGRLPAAARSEGLTSLSERSKKNAKSSRQLGKTDPWPRFSSMAVKEGRLRAAARFEGLTSLSERSKKNTKSSRQLGKRDPWPRFNSIAVKEGRLRAAARSEGLTSLSEWSKKNAKSSRQLARAAARAEKRLPVVLLLEGVL